MKLIWIFKYINLKFKFGEGQFMFVLKKQIDSGIFDLSFTKMKKIINFDFIML